MELKEQVISLEQAEKLNELWFSKQSIFEWHTIWDLPFTILYNPLQRSTYPDSVATRYTAYTSSELMDILPAYISPFELHIIKLLWWEEPDEYQVSYIRWYSEEENDCSYKSDYQFQNKNLTTALWDMLIYLLENNLMPTE